MDAKDIFNIWAPPESVWSRWAKPVIFTRLNEPYIQPVELKLPNVGAMNLPRPQEHTAMIVNLPGVHSVFMALALATMGYRPVPLYNSTDGPNAVVPVTEIVDAMLTGTPMMQGIRLEPEAPPAFMLDVNRLRGLVAPQPGKFDNRWVIFPQDMPSATFMRSQQIERVIVLQATNTFADDDLAHVFLRWRSAGIQIQVKDPYANGPIEEMSVHRPSQFKMRYLAFMFLFLGLRRSNVGGFGSMIPYSSGGG
jgi:hypothetical protein